MAKAELQPASQPQGFPEQAALLTEVGHACYQRGWALGTSGNFSSVLAEKPLRLAITASGADKGQLKPSQILEVDSKGRTLRGLGRPSDETPLHLTIVRTRAAGAVLHTHSVWATLLSDLHAERNGFRIENYEMLKGLSGVNSHEHSEWVPIIPNSQDLASVSRAVELLLHQERSIHGFLLQGHGLYVWGHDLVEARRHLEILEFLLEVVGRKRFEPPGRLAETDFSAEQTGGQTWPSSR